MDDRDPTARTGDAASVSVLFMRAEDRLAAGGLPEPECFADLNLDAVVAEATRGRLEHGVTAWYHAPLPDADAVRFRQDVFRDLEPELLQTAIRAFAATMRSLRGLLRQDLDDRHQAAMWQLEAVESYGRCVAELSRALAAADIGSTGLAAFRDDLSAYVRGTAFGSLVGEAVGVRNGLDAVEFSLRIRDGRITVSPPEAAPDYASEIERTFERFRRTAGRDYRTAFTTDPDLAYLGVLDRVARLNPDAFGALHAFCDRHRDFVDPAVAAFERDVQFYLGYLEFIAPLRAAGLPFCYPTVTEGSERMGAQATFDLALARKLVREGTAVVPNDWTLEGRERVIVVTGPNQGGKTTFARAFGQLHHLASLGCPVPGSQAEVTLCDRVLTHFGREERLDDLRGRLEDELQRLRTILERATPRSVLVLNEAFSSTTLADAVYLGSEVMCQIEGIGAIGVWVTFIDELASAGRQTVSMVGEVLAEDPTLRTFRIARGPAAGRAYAAAVAEKYGVGYAQLKRRFAR